MRTQSITNLISYSLRLAMIPILLIGLFGFGSRPASAVGTIIYVDINASGADDGTSWADAYTDLQSALSPAPLAGTEIWVASGTYIPGTAQSDTFQLLNGVAIYGGFDGSEATRDERDPKVNVTVLSGDIGIPSDMVDNIYHVVTGSGTDSTAVLDGFTVTAGNATNDPAELNGGGILNVGGSPTISNMVISNNMGIFGGGMFNYNGSSPTVTNVTFIGNSAQRAGGMYNNLNSHSILTNVTFESNVASSRGGGMTTSQSSPTLTNVTFHKNSAPSGGGLHNAFSGNPTLINVTFSGNSADMNGGSIYNDTSSPVIINSILYNNTQGTQLEIYDASSTPTVSYSIVEGGYTGTGNLDQDPLLGTLQDNGGYTQTMALGIGSPAIDAGDDGSCPADDQRGLSRPLGAHCDMGAYEFDNVPPDTTIDSVPPDPDDDSTPTFTFSGSDVGESGVASFMCRMDSGAFSACTSPFTSSVLSAGSHTFEVYAIDGNSNADPTPASYTWSLEFTPTLVTSIVLANASPTSAASVDFTVSLSADVTGVGTNDFSLTSTVSGASIASVTGSGSTYTVKVNTGTGNGSIRLNVPASAVVNDPYGNSLANLPYTTGETYTIFKSGTFADVPNTHPYYFDIEILYANGLTAGCATSPLKYCPDQIMDRAQAAVFMLRGSLGVGYTPPAVATHLFADNWAPGLWAEKWAEGMFNEGMTAGCSASPLKFCPWDLTPREQAAIFGLRLKYGNNYTPPAATGTLFADMTDTGYYATKWAEQAYIDGLIPSCGTSGGKPMFCPKELVTRGLGAYIIVKAKDLSMP